MQPTFWAGCCWAPASRSSEPGPGTVFAQLSAGYRSAAWVFIGGFSGALTFAYAEPALRPLLLADGPGK